MLWLSITFLAIAAVIVVSAMQLAKFGHGLADQTGLGKSLTGMILLASATSLPEFSVGFHAVSIGAVDLTAGDVLGSSLINLLIIASLDLLARKSRRLLSSSSSDHSLSGIVAILMTGLILLGMTIHFPGKFFGISPLGWATIATYAWCVRILFLDQQHFANNHKEEGIHHHFTMRFNIIGFVLCAAMIFYFAPKLADVADKLAQETGLGRTFFGTVFVALMTSLPEAISTFAAIRLKAVDMAVGNILGSNAFNMLVLVGTDIASEKSVLSQVSEVHAITATCVVITTAVTVLSLLYRAKKRWWLFEPDSALVVLLVLGALFLVYRYRNGF